MNSFENYINSLQEQLDRLTATPISCNLKRGGYPRQAEIRSMKILRDKKDILVGFALDGGSLYLWLSEIQAKASLDAGPKTAFCYSFLTELQTGLSDLALLENSELAQADEVLISTVDSCEELKIFDEAQNLLSDETVEGVSDANFDSEVIVPKKSRKKKTE